MNTNDIILTGIPRSGTTLTCHLLNKCKDTVALHEPMDVRLFGGFENDHGTIAGMVHDFFQEMRGSIMVNKEALTRHVAGSVPDNTASGFYTVSGLRRSIASKGMIPIQKELSADFRLVIKHPSAFSAALGELSRRFTCFAVVRNPIATLASWNTVEFQVHNGHVPGAERIDPELRAALSALSDRLDRQLFILAWFHEQYRSFLDRDRIIKYEDIIESGGKALRIITENAEFLEEDLNSMNRNKLYDRKMLDVLADRLLQTDGPYWDHYSSDEVESLLV